MSAPPDPHPPADPACDTCDRPAVQHSFAGRPGHRRHAWACAACAASPRLDAVARAWLLLAGPVITVEDCTPREPSG